jgi:hypothetical protein
MNLESNKSTRSSFRPTAMYVPHGDHLQNDTSACCVSNASREIRACALEDEDETELSEEGWRVERVEILDDFWIPLLSRA